MRQPLPVEVATYLEPGAQEELKLSRPIPDGYIPVVVYVPVQGMSFTIVGRTLESLTVANLGRLPGFVAIYFASESAMRKVAIAAPVVARLVTDAAKRIIRGLRS